MDVKIVYAEFVKHALQQSSYLTLSISGLTYNDPESRSFILSTYLPSFPQISELLSSRYYNAFASRNEPSLLHYYTVGGPHVRELRSLNLPSWLPRFTKSSKLPDTSHYHERNYQAGLGLTCDYHIAPRDLVLRLQGISVDTISDVSPGHDAFDTTRNLFENPFIDIIIEHVSRMAEIIEIFEKHGPRDGQIEENREAFWRTLLDDFNVEIFQNEANLAKTIIEIEDLLRTFQRDARRQYVDARPNLELSLKEFYKIGGTRQFPAFNVLLAATISGRPYATTQQKRLFAHMPTGTIVGDIVAIFNGAPAHAFCAH